jgi:hypothetical protein
MRLVLVDDSIPFDGYTPMAHPLGGAEKAVLSLASALAGRGHEVRVFNRCRYRMTIEGVQWEPWDRARPLECDALLAFRKPALLGSVRQAGKRLLWLAAPPAYLNRPANRELLEAFQPILLFQGPAHRASWRPEGLALADLPARLLPIGVRADYLGEAVSQPADPPLALATTHPAHGLDWLIGLWVTRIHPALPQARLRLYSAGLAKGLEGGPVPEGLAPILAAVKAAAAQGVEAVRPQGDLDMAQAYRTARVHLHPGHADDALASTLAESQAAGLPAVVRRLGAAPERIVDGQTGFVAPDDEAFANVALRLLSDDTLFWSQNREARFAQTGRGWERAAEELESILR